MADEEGFEPITTQEQLDGIVRSRVKRAEEKAEERVRAEYADYESLKNQVESETAASARLQEQLAGMERQLEGAQAEVNRYQIRERVSAEKGVPASLLQGDDEESISKSADELNGWLESRMKPAYPADKGASAPASKPTQASIESIPDPLARVRARAQNL